MGATTGWRAGLLYRDGTVAFGRMVGHTLQVLPGCGTRQVAVVLLDRGGVADGSQAIVYSERRLRDWLEEEEHMLKMTDVLEAVRATIYGSEEDVAGIADELDRIETMVDYAFACQTIVKAANTLRAEIEKGIVAELEGGGIRLGDTFVYCRNPTRKRVPRDPDDLMRYLADDVAVAVRPSDVRITSVRAIAERRGHDPEQVVERLFTWQEDEAPPKVAYTRMEYAPNYALQLQPGERRGPYRPPTQQAMKVTG